MRYHLIITVVSAVMEIRAVEIGVQKGWRLDQPARPNIMLQMVDESSRRDVACGATKRRLTAKRLEKKCLATPFSVAGLRREPTALIKPWVGQEIDVQNIGNQGIENRWCGLGTGKLVDNGITYEIA